MTPDPILSGVLKLTQAAVGKGVSVLPDTALLEGNLINSLGLISLVGALDEEFSIRVSTEDLTIQNFASPNSIAEVVRRYTQDN